MGRVRTGGPLGRPPTVAAREPTDAEARLVAIACLFWEENRQWPSVTEVAARGEWTRQRAHQLAKRLVDKGLVAMVPSTQSRVLVEVCGYKPTGTR